MDNHHQHFNAYFQKYPRPTYSSTSYWRQNEEHIWHFVLYLFSFFFLINWTFFLSMWRFTSFILMLNCLFLVYALIYLTSALFNALSSVFYFLTFKPSWMQHFQVTFGFFCSDSCLAWVLIPECYTDLAVCCLLLLHRLAGLLKKKKKISRETPACFLGKALRTIGVNKCPMA